jgi:pyruvate dehydrogenase E1 component
MTSLWFDALTAADRVSVKPHASPVLHAVNHLLGRLDASYLPAPARARRLQPYPSRTKDPDPVDFSTGSVGIGATAPVWGALTRRYVAATPTPRRAAATSRCSATRARRGRDLGVRRDPVVQQLGEVLWVVDLNRQSLDRIVPDIAISRWAACSPRPAGRCSR